MTLCTVSPDAALDGCARRRSGAGPAYGAAMTRGMLGSEEPTESFVLFARTLGIRNFVFGLGCLLAAQTGGDNSGLRRWLAMWLVSDLADVAIGVTGAPRVGRSGAVTAAIVPVPFVAAGVWALRRLTSPLNASNGSAV